MNVDERANDPSAADGLTRRQFLQAMAATSAVGAVAFTGCQPGHPIPGDEFLMQSRVHLSEDVLSGYESYYATTCRSCGAGCGLVVRMIEGRAKKIEGNPDHPLNRGKTCARAQSMVQEEYLPDRIQGPMRRDRRTNVWTSITWDEALTEVVSRLREVPGREALLLTGPMSGQRSSVVSRFSRAYGASWLTLDVLAEAPLREAVKRVFGQDRLPAFDIQNARYVMSFGSDFLGNGISPVRHGLEYGVFRQGSYRAGQFQPRQGRPRGYLVQAEPRMSITGAAADEWIPTRPGSEGLLALGMAQVIVSENLGEADGVRAVNASALRSVPLDQIAKDSGVTTARIQHLAREFASRRPSLALGGGIAGAHSNGTDSLAAILALNVLVGGLGRTGGVLFNPPPAIEGLPGPQAMKLSDWQQAAERLSQGQIKVALIAGANPVYSLPALRFADGLQKTPFVVSFSSFLDETTSLADLVLPSHLPLEDWGDEIVDPAPGYQIVGIQQPIVSPLYDTRGFVDVLLTVGDELGGAVKSALPWRSFQDMLRESARALQAERRGSVRAPDFERFWTVLLQQGGWWDESRTQAASTTTSGGGFPSSLKLPRYEGSEVEFPFHLVAFPHPALGSGESAHLPWLQALPDPMTSVAWQNWVEINPKLAAREGLREGDVVAVVSPHGRVEVPVYISPAASPDVLAIPMGQGHTASGRYASRDQQQRGTNPLSLLALVGDEATGALAYGDTRVRLVKTGRRVQLPKFEGTVPAYQVPHEEVIRITRES